MTGRPRETVYDCEAVNPMSYRFVHERRQIDYIQHLEREVDRLALLLDEEHGYDVAHELGVLEAEVDRLQHRLAERNELLVRAQDSDGKAELRAENARLRSELEAARTEAARAWARSAEVESLRAQVSNLLAVAPGGRWRSAARVSNAVEVEEEALGDRGRWAGLELA